MFTCVYLCLPLFTQVYICLLMFTLVYWCLHIFTLVYLCIPLFTRVYLCFLCLPKFTCAYLSLLVFSRACLPIFTPGYSYLPMLTPVNIIMMKLRHKSPTPVRDLGSNLSIKYLSPCSGIKGDSSFEKVIERELMKVSDYEYVEVTQFLPSDPAKKHCSLDGLLQKGLSIPSVLLTYSPGSNIGNMHFIWKVSDLNPLECLEHIQQSIEEVKQVIPKYHTRAMRSLLFQKFGRVSPIVKPAALRYFYRSLTGQ